MKTESGVVLVPVFTTHRSNTVPTSGAADIRCSSAAALGTLGAAAFLQDGTWSLRLQELEQEQELPVVCAVAAGGLFAERVKVQRNQQKSALLLEGML